MIDEQDQRKRLALSPPVGGSAHPDAQEIAARLAEEDPRVRWVPNPSGRTPDALNVALRASGHDIVVRVDGHGVANLVHQREIVVRVAVEAALVEALPAQAEAF